MKIVIDITPQAKGRPRIGKGRHAYTPPKTREYEAAVSWFLKKAMKEPMEGPLKVDIKFYLPIPKSWSKTKYQASKDGSIRPTTKPDIDNLSKAILDAANGILYEDDKQIVELNVEKFYGDPRTEIEMEEL